uniref:Uncharacterized protein n=1 Tax=Siphoviridae sp. ctw757 TaxID=2827969 RepID=A0A8S5TBK8_9CAUD|nr:MAG TPA: hypothetical protein [Siphoviridae sp. ctw757]DAX79108.1 MAG TPA: hypothetical protein [Caudoviricetes sp.]DAY90707.1 MAG TPA: hypothetical protein [Caudoviricetes sp.]
MCICLRNPNKHGVFHCRIPCLSLSLSLFICM